MPRLYGSHFVDASAFLTRFPSANEFRRLESLMKRQASRRIVVVGIVLSLALASMRPADAAVTAKEVERAIAEGVRFLKQEQKDDGSWKDADGDARTGTTSLVSLALITAGEPLNSPAVSRALNYLRNFGPDELGSTYSVSLQTMVFAAAEPRRDQLKIAANVEWLTRAQIRPGEKVLWPGTWTYSPNKSMFGDNSNTQYALLGLNAASEAGIPVSAEVWALARRHWEKTQRHDGSWAYTPEPQTPASGSMTCAGVSSLIITGLKRFQGKERIVGDQIENCGLGGTNTKLQAGLDWLATHFSVSQNFGNGPFWRFYYLYGMERAGRLTGQRYFGNHDWYREGAERLVRDQNPIRGTWQGVNAEIKPVVATSFAVLFLAKGRSPVLVNKLRHNPRGDWNNDVDDIRNLVSEVSRDWNTLLTWQVVDPNTASVEDMLQAPIAYFNGHQNPDFSPEGAKNLRDFVEQGGFIFAEACCGRAEFDRGFKALMESLFPEPEYRLHPLPPEHAVWNAKHQLSPDVHPLWGIEHGCRTVVVYSPGDLSCFWNQAESVPRDSNPHISFALKLGQNVVDYATGRERPADKLIVREVKDFKADAPKRGALHIAKLKYAPDWNIAPLAVPNLTNSLKNRLGLDVVINHKELPLGDPNLVLYPLVYIHGRANFSIGESEREWLRHHLEPGGGTLFADAACGSPAFDAAFRRFVAEMLPKHPLVPIPRDDEIYSEKIGGYDLSKSHYSKSAGGGLDYPQLEGVKIDGHWAVIYSKLDIGCALERHQVLDCKGYTPESAEKIATNIVIYSTLP
ncbi:DUF4159 domain-containing protein [Singulisphaera sp. PoT]|uniref:DUF4159 domain-containing protein n=1 Tax=Singulisphaera sp. PoT TaxID=3411797 RepID=UPI003BF609B5